MYSLFSLKKLSCFIFTLLLLAATLLTPAFADAGNTLPDKEELEAMVDRALLIRSILGARRYPWDYSVSMDKVEVLEDGNGIAAKWIYRPALQGFDAEGIKSLVANTLTKDYAGSVIERNKPFFDDFKEIDGKLYYKERGYTLTNGFMEYRRDPDTEIRIEKITGDTSIIVVRLLPPAVDPLPNNTIRIFMAKEDNKWKISGYDCHEFLLNANAEIMKSEEFSEAVALQAIEAVIMEGYYYTSLNSHSTDLYYGLGGGSPLLEGSLAYPKTWRDYLSQFATSDVLDSVLFKNDRVRIRDDGLIERFKSGGNLDVYLVVEEEALSADRLKINVAGANEASCTYRLGYGTNEITAITVNFTKTGDGWRISGGDFVSKMHDCFVADESAETGDRSILPFVIVLLTAMGLFFKKNSLLSRVK